MPGPSQNRERAAPFQGNRHYFHKPTPVGMWKIRLTAVALFAAVGWLAIGLIQKDRLYRDTSPGQVARPHAAWDDRCDACHAPAGAADSTGSGLFGTRERWRSFRCAGCHAGSADDPKNYAPHHASIAWKDDRADDCAACHSEHQGRDASLVRVPDSGCVRCHENLNARHQAGAPEFTQTVGRFKAGRADSHPEFRPVAAAPKRTLQFDHGKHLALGLVAKAGLNNANAPYTLNQIDPAYQPMYQRFADGRDAPIRLDCAACHQLDAGVGDPGLPAAQGLPRAAGAYYLPIVFEKHCQGCHSQTITALQTVAHGVKTEKFTVPHRVQPPNLDQYLRAEFLRQIAEQKAVLDKLPVPPGDRLDPRPIAVPPTLIADRDDWMAKVNALLYDAPTGSSSPTLQGGHGCRKCHALDGGKIPAAKIEPVTSPTIWLPHAKFNHAAHRAVQCAGCHHTYESGPVAKPEPLNLPGIDTCRRCHGPATVTADAQPQGGVRHNCVDCHRYHNGDRPLHGPGSPRRDPPGERLTIPQFLRGGKAPERNP